LSVPSVSRPAEIPATPDFFWVEMAGGRGAFRASRRLVSRYETGMATVGRRIVWTVAAIFAPLAVAVASAPYLVDADSYKPALVQAVKEATGRELVIDGPMHVTLFPWPRVSAQQVHFANAPGAVGAQMVDVRWVGASPSLWALLHGQVEAGELILYRPTIVLETDANGVPNWQFEPGGGAAQAPGAPAAGFHLAIGELRIRQGTISYTNPQTHQTIKAEDVEATASVGSFDGPFSIAGAATLNGVPLKLEFGLGAGGADGHQTSFAVQAPNGKLDFKGTLSALDTSARLAGHLTMTTGGLAEFIAALVRASGQAAPDVDPSIVGYFAFDGDIEVAPTRLGLSDFKLAIGGESATGSLSLERGQTVSLQGHLALPKMNLDRWLALARQSDALLPPARMATAAGAIAAMDVSLGLNATEIDYRGGTVRDVAAALEVDKGVITVPSFQALLPGDLAVQANASAGGDISIAGPRLRDTLAWLGIDTSSVPKDRLQAVDIKGKLATAGGALKASDLSIRLDDQTATGSGSLTLGVPLTAAASLQADRFDLDAYLPPSADPAPLSTVVPIADQPGQPAAASLVPSLVVPPAPPPPDKSMPVVGVKAKIAKLVFRGQTLGGVDGDASVQGDLLTLNAVTVADLLGGKLSAKGAVASVATQPRFDLTVNATLPDADKVLDYAGLPTFINSKMGQASASGAVAGTRDVLALGNVTVGALGSTAHLTGGLALGSAFRFDFSSFSLQADEAARLLAVATGRPQGPPIGALSAAGAFKGDRGSAAFDGSLTALGVPATGHVEATLAGRLKIAANLRLPGTLDVDDWLGVANGPPGAANTPPQAPLPPQRVATPKPIDLSALRAFDASLMLQTSAMAVASLKVDYADLQATLTAGVLHLDKLTGQFYGGGVDFHGTVDATEDALAVDLGGTLQGIDLGRMLRGAAGTNTFGNDDLTVSIDGKIDLTNVAVRGSGRTPEEIRNALGGQGQLRGTVYPTVVKGSLGLASFATGIGSIFSTTMGFNSAVLSAFVGHQNTIAGEVTMANGTLTFSRQTVQGQGAVATIAGTTSLMQATTDTTVTLSTGTQGAPAYVMTMKGPIAAPTLSVRGAGN
jgi:uncharacterized protein involved in outer membrane biogenesis